MRFHVGLVSKLKNMFFSSAFKKPENPETGVDFKSKAAEFGSGFKVPDFAFKKQENPETGLDFKSKAAEFGSGFKVPDFAFKKQENPETGLNFKSKTAEFGSGFKVPDFGSREEAFFDSKLMFDSDCEDDFYSVNGDFTPSRGSTPNYQTGIPNVPTLNEPFILAKKFHDSETETSPTGRRKLADLLRETWLGEQTDEPGICGEKPDSYIVGTDQHTKSPNGTHYMSGETSVCSSESTPSGYSNKKKAKVGNSVNCCFPGVVRNFSFNDRRQKLIPESCGA